MISFKKFLNEGQSKRLIVVDVQPGYDAFCRKITGNVVEQIQTAQEVIYFYNNEELTGDTKNDVISYLYDNGIEDISNITFVDKYYAFHRDLMDSGFDYDDISKVARLMLRSKYMDATNVKIQGT